MPERVSATRAARVLARGGGQGEEERRADAGLRRDPDPPAVALDDVPADRQSGADARIFLFRVEATEQTEQPPGPFRRYADAVVADREDPDLTVLPGSDSHLRGSGTPELQRVVDQVLEDLGELDRVGDQARHLAPRYDRPALVDRVAQVG